MSSAFLRRLATMSAIAVALALAAGLGPAGPAAHAAPPPRLAEAGPSAGASHAVRPASVSGIECFYVYPECSSSDPSVYSNITNLTDTSTCTFEWTAVWGDGQSDTVDVNGGPAGTLEYTFTHKYDSTNPDTYHLTISGIVTGNSDPSEVTCSAVGATPTFNLTPAVGLAALRFAPLSGTALTTPGLAVIKDDGPRTKIDTLDGPDKCDGVAQPESYDYLACQSPVPGLSGPSDKEWPVIFPVGSKFSVNKVVFVANGPVKDPQLTANVSVPGSGFYPDLADAPMTVQKKGNVYELTAKDLTFAGGTLPVNLTGRDLLYISWTITEGDTQIDLAGGDEHFTVYVPAAPYAPPLDGSIGADEVDEPYESLIDVGTVAAAGQTTEQRRLRRDLEGLRHPRHRPPDTGPEDRRGHRRTHLQVLRRPVPRHRRLVQQAVRILPGLHEVPDRRLRPLRQLRRVPRRGAGLPGHHGQGDRPRELRREREGVVLPQLQPRPRPGQGHRPR